MSTSSKHNPHRRFAPRSNRRSFLHGAAHIGAAATLATMGCRQPKHALESPSNTPRVVATTGMIADLVRWIAHDLVDLKQLIGPGVDPHLYKPIRDDVVDVLRSDLVLFNGLLLEGRMSELLSEAASSTRNVFPLASAIPAERYLGEPGTDAKDPHIWMDVSMWSIASRSVEEELAKILIDKNEIIRQRGQDLRSELEKLDQRGLQAIRSIPPRQRVLITSHDAFQYFGRRYGLEVQGIQGISTTSEAGLQRIPELIDLILTRSVPAVFCESSVAGKLINALIEGAQARGYSLHLGENLYSDALGPSGSPADSYIGMMEHNFRTIATALGGSWES